MSIETYEPIPKEYQPAVDEVVRFVTEGQLLAKPFEPARFNDYPVEIVYDVLDWTPYRNALSPDAKCEEAWQDIRISFEREHIRLSASTHEESERKYPEIWSAKATEKRNEIYFFLRPIIENQLRKEFPKFDPDDDIAEIDLHIDLIVGSRSRVGSAQKKLSEEILFNVYKAYGYPCGWIGPFPGGRLLVFSRK